MIVKVIVLYILILTVNCQINNNSSEDDLSEVVEVEEVNENESITDEVTCSAQLNYLQVSQVGLKFLDASARLPSAIGWGNINDLGNYHQCLSIREEANDMLFEGKYCTILVAFDQNTINVPDSNDTILESRRKYHELRKGMFAITGQTNGLHDPQSRVAPLIVMSSLGSTIALCIPKVCPTKQVVEYLQRYLLIFDLDYQEYYCRLPNDKPITAADYTAMAIFGFIGVLIICSTIYDLHHVFVLKRDQKRASVLYRSFSVYTNLSRLLTFNKSPGAIECMDGIRAISMFWVMIGHTFVVTNLAYVQNLTYVAEWLQSFWSLWITSAPFTVDTFFLLSGILCVYGIIHRISRIRFLKTLHLYIANRLMRMFPILAAVVLLQASLFNHLADGPYWLSVSESVDRCRNYWWSALLHVQNYVNPFEICLGHAWYISVDTQLYVVAPVVITFLYGGKKVAFGVLTLATTVSLAICVAYSFVYNFPSVIVSFGRFDEFNDYMTHYYINTITRSPPFFIGMMYGYVMHLYRHKRLIINHYLVFAFWITSFVLLALAFFSTYPTIQTDHDNQLLDNLLNGFIRSIWALALGWIILACHHNYGGPINWFLSLQFWKLPARLSYAMFMLHFPLQMVVNGTWTQTKYFTTGDAIYRFLSDVLMSTLAAIVLSLVVDSPFSTLQKLMMGGGGGGGRRRGPPEKDDAPDEVKSETNGVKFSIQSFEKTTL